MPDHLDEKEKAIFRKLTDGLQPTALEVQDVSGGCGSMYSVSITSERFKGLAVIKQHRFVPKLLERYRYWATFILLGNSMSPGIPVCFPIMKQWYSQGLQETSL
ncbi:hypothetical protein EG328_009758 [Venturia inaequalis]|uniref:Uncharacterized protein n=1 Tax=Venturia inaequalis TaxID=5025 RepID=A0A8H3VAS7_VENIN|nr:hypothetical protein EG328_009758 [Venturia inaequalis]KAE9983718.1 hypothetical protein EG327_005395 [Venturia inaequalis]